jgi:CRISPR/Cas system-associated endonuclease Cas3-HD
VTEIGLAEYSSMAEAIGIILTLFVILYFSKKQMQSLSVDLETKILNDLDDKINGLTHKMIENPNLIKVVSKGEKNFTSELAFSYHILYTFAHAFHMYQRKVVSNNEWSGWLRWIKSAFQHGDLYDIWKNNIELEKWFDPAFSEFINKEIVPTIKR